MSVDEVHKELPNKGGPTEPEHNWLNVRNFFILTEPIFGKDHILTIDVYGCVSHTKAKGKKWLNNYLDSWRKWSDTINKVRKPTSFYYPVWMINQAYNNFLKIAGFAGIGVLIVFFLHGLDSISGREEIPIGIVFIIIVAFVMLVFVELFKIKHPKKFFRISITEEKLKVNFIDGDTCEFSLKGIKRYYFDIKARNALIIFDEGTKLLHLERVSDWPILREYLLSILNPSEKKCENTDVNYE